MEIPLDFNHASYAIIRSESISPSGMSFPIHEPHEAVECGAVGLDEPYLPQTFQTVDNLPHENKKEKTAMIAVKSGGHVIGGESTSLTSQSCDDILQPVGILGNLLVQ